MSESDKPELGLADAARAKAIAAGMSGLMLLVLAVGVTLDALRRFFGGSDPIGMP